VTSGLFPSGLWSSRDLLQSSMQQATKQQTIRQHYVTAGYLAGFTLGGERDSPFFVHSLQGHVREDIPGHVGFERHYHTIDIPGVSPDHLESVFQNIEGPACSLFKTLSANPGRPLLTELEVHAAIYFLVVQAARVPQSKRRYEGLIVDAGCSFMEQVSSSPEFFQRVMASVRQQGIVTDSVEQSWLRKGVESGQLTVHADKTNVAIGMLRLASAIADQLEGVHWTLWYADGPDWFICSDYPVGLFFSVAADNFLEDPRAIENPTVQLLANTIYMPLARNVAMVVHGHEGIPLVQRANQRMVAIVNAITVSHAQRFICSPTRDFVCTLPGGRMGNAREAVNALVSLQRIGPA
jgi:hypothetical protein